MRKKLEVKFGHKFNRLTVIEELPRDEFKHRCFRCKCSCGNVVESISLCHLSTNKIKSCGCLQKEVIEQHIAKCTTHGYSKNKAKNCPEYKIWMGMRSRCNNKNVEKYSNYGGRGIKVCDRWDDFKNFIDDMGKRPGPGYSIERINNNGNYEPGNCKWATQEEQANNKRTNKLITAFGETKTIKQWSKDARCIITYDNLHDRIEKGYDAEFALITPFLNI